MSFAQKIVESIKDEDFKKADKFFTESMREKSLVNITEARKNAAKRFFKKK